MIMRKESSWFKGFASEKTFQKIPLNKFIPRKATYVAKQFLGFSPIEVEHIPNSY